MDETEEDRELLRALNLAENGRFAESLSVLDRALKRNPGFQMAWIAKGNVLGMQQQIEESISPYTRAIKLDPDSAIAWSCRANALVLLKRYPEALADNDVAIRLDPDFVSSWETRGDILHGLYRFDEAAIAFDRAIAIDPTFSAAWIGKGAALHELTLHAEAIAAFDRAIELHTQLALRYLRLDMNQDLASIWNSKGNALHSMSQHAGAIVAFDLAIRLRPKEPAPWNGRGNALNGLGHYAEAITAFESAIANAPDIAGPWTGKGNAFCARGQFAEALAALQQAVKLEPGSATPWFALNNLLRASGDIGQFTLADRARIAARGFACLRTRRHGEPYGAICSNHLLDPTLPVELPLLTLRLLKRADLTGLSVAQRLSAELLGTCASAFRLAETLILDDRFLPAPRNIQAGLLNLLYGDPVEAAEQFEAAIAADPCNVIGHWGRISCQLAMFHDLDSPECEAALAAMAPHVNAIVVSPKGIPSWQRFFAARLALLDTEDATALALARDEAEFVPLLVFGAWLAAERCGDAGLADDLARRALSAEADSRTRDLSPGFRMLAPPPPDSYPPLPANPHKLTEWIVWTAITQECEEALLWFVSRPDFHQLPEWHALFGATESWDTQLARTYARWLGTAPVSAPLANRLGTIEELRKDAVLTELEAMLSGHLAAWGLDDHRQLEGSALCTRLAILIASKTFFEENRLLIKAISLFWMRGALGGRTAERLFHYALARECWVLRHDPSRCDLAVNLAVGALGQICALLVGPVAAALANFAASVAAETSRVRVQKVLNDRRENDPFPSFELFCRSYDGPLGSSGAPSASALGRTCS